MQKKEIRKARESLRNIYKKYIKELHNVISKIDKDLEEIEKNGSV